MQPTQHLQKCDNCLQPIKTKKHYSVSTRLRFYVTVCRDCFIILRTLSEAAAREPYHSHPPSTFSPPVPVGPYQAPSRPLYPSPGCGIDYLDVSTYKDSHIHSITEFTDNISKISRFSVNDHSNRASLALHPQTLPWQPEMKILTFEKSNDDQ